MGVDIEIEDNAGQNPLKIASENNAIDVVEVESHASNA